MSTSLRLPFLFFASVYFITPTLSSCNAGDPGKNSHDTSTVAGKLTIAAREVGQATKQVGGELKEAGNDLKDATRSTANSVKDAFAKKVNTDTNFVAEAYLENNEQLLLLQSALKKGSSKDLKDCARKMMVDHRRLADELKALATQKGYPIAKEGEDITDQLADMKDKRGNDWDKAWAAQLIHDHETSIDKYMRAKSSTNDKDLKNFITNALPVIHHDLDMLKTLSATL